MSEILKRGATAEIILKDLPLSWLEIIYHVLFRSGPKGLEIALVLSGVKPGDWVNWLTPDRIWVLDQLEKLQEIGVPLEMISVEDRTNVYFHNTNIPKFIVDELKHSLTVKTRISSAIGEYFGYPLCCVMAMERDEGTEKVLPYTEHRWCKPECQYSLEIQKRHKEALNRIFPWLPACKEGLPFYDLLLRNSYTEWRNQFPNGDPFWKKIDHIRDVFQRQIG